MAYAVKYLFKFQSSNGTVREIRVLQDGYSGAVIQRPLGRAPVIKKEQNGGVHGTSLTFYAECHVDREFIEFYTSDPKEYRVDVYAGSTLLWQGYITPELYSEPDIAPPYDVEVVATDGVGELKLYDFAPQGTVTLRSLLSYLLGYTGLSTDVNLVSSLKPGSHGAGALLDMQICVDYLEGKTCYEALTYLLDTLHATITRWGGAWLLVRETNVTFTNDKVRYFNTAGNSALLSGSVQTLGSMRSAPAWPVGQLSMVIDPAKNKVTVQAPWHPVTCLANADMTSDTAWAKENNASYGPDGYLFPNNDTGGSSYTTAHISQSIASAGLRVPMSFELKATGVAAQVGARVGAVIGVLITYTVGSTVYLLRRGDEGTPVWKEGSAPGSSIDGSLVDYQQPLASFDADRIQAETLNIDEIPAFVQGTTYPSGTLTVYVIGTCARAYSAHLDVVLPKGYQDVLRIDNGARGEGDTVEIAIGRETADAAYYAAFLQGLLLDNGALITSFADANFTDGMNYLALIARDCALSVALPRASVKGTVYLESSIGVPPLVFAKGGLNYWIETWSWDLYEDELEISARTLPSASLTVQSETILESDGSTVSSVSTAGSSGGGGGGSFPRGVNYFELDDTLVRLKGQYDYLGPRKGLIFEGVGENESSDADLYVKEITVGNSTQRVLYSPLPLITEGDQIVGSGTPGGGGGGGVDNLYKLEDVYGNFTTGRVKTAAGADVSDGQALVWSGTLSKWVAGTVQSGGTYYRDFGITLNNNAFSVAHDVAAYEDEQTITFDPDSHSGVMAENPVEWGAAITYGVNLMVNNTTKGLALASSIVDLWTAVNGKQPAGNYLTSVPLATDSVIGGFQTGFTQSGKNYPVQLSSNKAYVNVPWTDTTYSNATTSTAGLMSAADKTKLNGIAEGANNYSLPTASSSVLGGIKIGTGLTIDSSGVVSVTGQTQGTVTRVDVGSTAYNPDTNGIVSIPAYPTVPTNVSAFTNDAGYITSYINTWRNVYTGGTSRVGTGTDTKAINFAAGSNVTITYEAAGTGSGQSGSANYFNVKIAASMAFSNLTSHPSTIAGYGITDAKIENGVITLGSNTITPLTSHQTLYNLVIYNSAGTAQLTYKPATSGTYTLTLTKGMVGLGNVPNWAVTSIDASAATYGSSATN